MVGKTSEIQLASTWNSPGFNGAFLPDERTVNKEGFTANWKILELRNYPQCREANEYFNEMKSSAFFTQSHYLKSKIKTYVFYQKMHVLNYF